MQDTTHIVVVVDSVYSAKQIAEINARYIEVLEGTNQQLTNWFSPYGVVIAIFSLLIGIGAIAATLAVWYTTKQSKKMLKQFESDSKALLAKQSQSLDKAESDFEALANRVNSELKSFLQDGDLRIAEAIKEAGKMAEPQLSNTNQIDERNRLQIQLNVLNSSLDDPNRIEHDQAAAKNLDRLANIIISRLLSSPGQTLNEIAADLQRNGRYSQESIRAAMRIASTRLDAHATSRRFASGLLAKLFKGETTLRELSSVMNEQGYSPEEIQVALDVLQGRSNFQIGDFILVMLRRLFGQIEGNDLPVKMAESGFSKEEILFALNIIRRESAKEKPKNTNTAQDEPRAD